MILKTEKRFMLNINFESRIMLMINLCMLSGRVICLIKEKIY